MTVLEIESFALIAAIFVVIIGGLVNRYHLKKGIGWQFIRYCVLTISLSLCGLLALNNALTSEAATIISAAMGFTFGKVGKDE